MVDPPKPVDWARRGAREGEEGARFRFVKVEEKAEEGVKVELGVKVDVGVKVEEEERGAEEGGAADE